MEDLQADLSAHGLSVSTLPEKGRGLVAIKDFSPGLSFYQISVCSFSKIIIPMLGGQSISELKEKGKGPKSKIKKLRER